MLIPNHPADERLSALASRDRDAVEDAALTAHVPDCTRCTAVLDELNGLRLALSDLPDLAPDRPLRLLPPVEADREPTDRLTGWARRFFAPVLASGAAVALVGLIGTTGLGPSAQQGSAPANDSATELSNESAASAEVFGAPDAGGEDAGSGGSAAGGAAPSEAVEEQGGDGAARTSADEFSPFVSDDDGRTGPSPLESQRSPWPMVLFAGVAIMIGAVLLRWILVPRAG
jgi:hypothetical protein